MSKSFLPYIDSKINKNEINLYSKRIIQRKDCRRRELNSWAVECLSTPFGKSINQSIAIQENNSHGSKKSEGALDKTEDENLNLENTGDLVAIANHNSTVSIESIE